MKNIIVIIFPFILIIVVIYGIFTGKSSEWEVEIEKYYKAVPVAIRDVESIIHTRGKICASNTEPVLAKVDGVVSEIFVQAGESVSKDQVLANLASESLQEQIEQRRLSLQIDKNNYLSAKAQADRRLVEATKNYQDIKGLYRLQFASKSELEKALQGYEDAKKETIIDTLDSIPTDLERGYLKYRQSELKLANLYKDLEATTVKSPISGTVTDICIKNFDSVRLDSKLFEIAVYDEFEIHVNVGEHEVNEVKSGMNVIITGDAFENDYQGKVTSISTSSDDSSEVKVIIDIEDEQGELKHNVQASVDIFLSSVKNVVTVPVDAIGINPRGETVVIEKFWDSDLEAYLYIPRVVFAGIQNDRYVQVTSEEVQVGIDVIAVYKSELDRSSKVK